VVFFLDADDSFAVGGTDKDGVVLVALPPGDLLPEGVSRMGSTPLSLGVGVPSLSNP
jgi:hypothetical protein